MQTIPIHSNLFGLPLGERIDLAQQLIESVRSEVAAAPLTPEQFAEVRRRLAAVSAGTMPCQPFAEAMLELRPK